MSEKPNQKKPLIFPPGTPIEIRVEEDGFTGSWYEATVVKPLLNSQNPNFQIFEFNGNILYPNDQITIQNPNLQNSNDQNPNLQKNPNFQNFNDLFFQNPNFQNLSNQNPNNQTAEKRPYFENPNNPNAEKSLFFENPNAEKSFYFENPNTAKSPYFENPNFQNFNGQFFQNPNDKNFNFQNLSDQNPNVVNPNAEKSLDIENPNTEKSLYFENPDTEKRPTVENPNTEKSVYIENLNYDELLYEIEYKDLLCDDEKTLLREETKATNIRPKLQKIKHNYQLNDVVEAFHLDGWWIGIITKITPLNNNDNNNNNNNNNNNDNDDDIMYEVTFPNPADLIEFKGSDIRLHFDWIDAKWVRPLKTVTNLSISGETSGKKNKRKQSNILEGNGGETENGLSSVMKTPLSRKKTLARRVTSGTYSSKRRKAQKTYSSSVSNDITNMEKRKGLSEVYCRRKDGKAAGNQQSPSSNSSPDTQPPSLLLAGIFLKSTVQDLPDSTTANRSSFVEQAVVSAAVVEGNQGEVTNANNELGTVKKAASVDRNDDKSIDTNHQDFESAAALVADTAVEIAVIDPNNGKGEMREQVSVVEGNDKSIDFNYQNMESVVAVVADTAVEVGIIDPNKEKGEMEARVSAVEDNANPIDSDDHSLPFVKTLLPVWKIIESLDAFHAIPQKPHFQMLVNDSPESREIKAIAHMLTFSRVAKKITELQFDDPRGSIEDCLKDLVELEENGFDVNAIRNRVSSLLSKKDEYGNLLNQLKEHKNQLVEHNCEKGKILEEIGLFDKQIKELQEKRGLAYSMREDVKTKIMCVELKLKSTQQAIDNLYSSGKVAAFP